jgi:hypothetical protein
MLNRRQSKTDALRQAAGSPKVIATVAIAAAAGAAGVAGRRRGGRSDAAQVDGYCMKERKHVAIKDPVQTTMKNGRPAIRGFCPDCGTKIFKIGSMPA